MIKRCIGRMTAAACAMLLLLMAGDCAEDQNTALLTLALYFFM